MNDLNMNAFPSVPGTFQERLGMSLRDYFAAKAMQAVPMTRTSMNNKSEAKHIAVHAYVMADAMLEARK